MIIALYILFGAALLYIGAEYLVRHSSHLAGILKVSPLIIGLTVVAFGTSTPELIVNVNASLSGNTEIALGNIVGSNIFNVLFILGISAIVCPLVVNKQLIWMDSPIMVLASLMTWWFASYGSIGFGTGVLFILLIVTYTAFLIYKAKNESRDEKKKESEFDKEYKVQELFSWKIVVKDLLWIVLSLFILVIGSEFLVNGAVSLAKLLGVSELVISLTIVAAGTSLPELATSVIAAMKKERDIAIGNILGSNIYNIWAILGVSAILAPNGLPIPEGALAFDIPVMVAVAIACLPIFFTGHMISRSEGILFLLYYCLYIVHILMVAVKTPWLNSFQDSMLFFVFPLTLIGLGISCYRELKNNYR